MHTRKLKSKKRNVRVRKWLDFKRLAMEIRPTSIVYIIAQSIPASHLTSLKLILPAECTQYIFIDTAKGNKLRQTEIRIHRDQKGNCFLEDEEVKSFLKKELLREDLKILSYWTI